jgi:lysyl-tRNA synthetase class II
MRERKKYISLTLLRPKTQIPLGELKLAIKINDAQRHEYLSKIAEGDTVKIKGKVFSAALGEPWVDINQIQVTKGPNSKKNEEESEKENAEYLEGF